MSEVELPPRGAAAARARALDSASGVWLLEVMTNTRPIAKSASSVKKASTKKSGPKKVAASAPHRKKAVARAVGPTPPGCTYSVNWSVLATAKGYTQVWVPTEHYERALQYFKKHAKDGKPKSVALRRKPKIGVTWVCGGSCAGGWCHEAEVPQNPTSAVYVCECAYFV